MADAGIRLTVEGEKEFRAALAECDTAVKNNQKALKLLTEEYKLNDAGMKDATSGFGSMAEAQQILATKGKVLADSIEVQTEKVGLLDARVQEASETYGEHDKRTEALRGQLYEASVALTTLTAEQEKNRQAMADAENSTAQYDEAVKALEAQLAANQAELKAMGGGLDALKKDYAETEKESGELEKATGKLGAGYVSLGKVFGDTGKDAEDLQKKEELLRKQEENLQKQNQNLADQNAKLADSISKQKDLIDALAGAQETAAKRYGEGSTQAEGYRKKIAEATGQLDAMERELRENEQAIRDNNKAVEDGGEAPNGMLDGLKAIEEMTGIKIPAGIETMIGGFAGGAGAVGGIVAALKTVHDEMEKIWKESLSWAEDVSTESAELDLSTEQYQELEYIAKATGTSVSSLTGALEKIEQKAADAAYTQETLGLKIAAMREEMEKAQESREYWSDRYVKSGFDEAFSSQVELATQRYEEAKTAIEELETQLGEASSYFDELGISIYDANGDVKNSMDLMYELIDAYNGIESAAIRNKEMSDLLGKSYNKLKPYLSSGSEGLKKMTEEAHNLDFVLKEEQVDALNRAGIAMDIYEKKLDAIDAKWAAMKAKGHSGATLWIQMVAEKVGAWFDWKNGKFNPQYASGTNYAPGGYALVGERGPEIVDLPRGSKVYPNGVVPAGLAGGTTVNESNVYNISIDASSVEEFDDIVRIARGARVGMRRG